MGEHQLSNQTSHTLVMATTLNKIQVSMLNVLQPHIDHMGDDNTMAIFCDENDKDRLVGTMAAVLKCVACLGFAVDRVLGALA